MNHSICSEATCCHLGMEFHFFFSLNQLSELQNTTKMAPFASKLLHEELHRWACDQDSPGFTEYYSNWVARMCRQDWKALKHVFFQLYVLWWVQFWRYCISSTNSLSGKGFKTFFKGVLELSPDEIKKTKQNKLHKTKKKNLVRKLPLGLKTKQNKTENIPGRMAAEGSQVDPLSGQEIICNLALHYTIHWFYNSRTAIYLKSP